MCFAALLPVYVCALQRQGLKCVTLEAFSSPLLHFTHPSLHLSALLNLPCFLLSLSLCSYDYTHKRKTKSYITAIRQHLNACWQSTLRQVYISCLAHTLSDTHTNTQRTEHWHKDTHMHAIVIIYEHAHKETLNFISLSLSLPWFVCKISLHSCKHTTRIQYALHSIPHNYKRRCVFC